MLFLFFFAFSKSRIRFSRTRLKLGLNVPSSVDFLGEKLPGLFRVGELLLEEMKGRESFLFVDLYLLLSVRIFKGYSGSMFPWAT